MSSAILKEAERVMTICNACRYCEGFCAVFPAMELRRTFTSQDLTYFSNLCHNCRGCYYACQYAPPHEFALNVPRTLAQLRQESYAQFAWPQQLKTFFAHNGLLVTLICVLSLIGFIALTALVQSADTLFAAHRGPGAFYRVVSYPAMVVPFTLIAVWIVIGFWKGLGRFRQRVGLSAADFRNWRAHRQALWDVLRLKYLDGGGHGCNYPDDRFSMIRRYYHHAIFYGFLLCFASTTVAFFYDHLLGRIAPYPFLSWPVVLGTVGGLALAFGTGGMLVLRKRMDAEPANPAAFGMDVVFTSLLFLVSVSGLVLLVLRSTQLMGILLVVHLALVLGLFLTLPYGKFVHAVYRYGALVKNAIEQANANAKS